MFWSYKKHLFEDWMLYTPSPLYPRRVKNLHNFFSGKQARHILEPQCECVWRRPWHETSGSQIKEINQTERRAYMSYSNWQDASEACKASELFCMWLFITWFVVGYYSFSKVCSFVEKCKNRAFNLLQLLCFFFTMGMLVKFL